MSGPRYIKIMKHLKEYESHEEDQSGWPKNFEDLPKEVQDKALDKNRNIDTSDDFWFENVIDDFIVDMEPYGFDLSREDIQFTGFYSQGDGASFVAKHIDSKKFLEKALNRKSDEYLNMENEEEERKDDLRALKMDLEDLGFDRFRRVTPEDLYISIVRTSHQYSHENTVEVSLEVDDIPEREDDDDRNWPRWEEALMRDASKWVRAKCKELYSKLAKEYEFLQSDESVRETLIGNGYLFDVEGDITTG